ncbi:MAG: VOC family protein [Thermoanaerobaculia bacterium]
MKPTPPGWPRISSALSYDEGSKAIDFLCDAFGFELRLKVEGDEGRIVHSELVFGEGIVMVADVEGKAEKCPQMASPVQVGAKNTQSLMVYVDDVEAHCAQARAAGARIVKEPTTTDYGEEYWTDRGYECVDPGGHHWWFQQRLRNPKAT